MAERRIVDIGPFLEDLKKELKDLEGSTEALTVEEAAEDEIEDLKKLPVIDPEKMIPAWRDPDKDPPKVETEVLILYRCNGYMGITTAHYEDGKILPGELQALVMVSNCLEREFIHRQLATGRPLHLNI